MFPTSNTTWKLSYSDLLPYIDPDVHQENGYVLAQVVTSNIFEITIKISKGSGRKRWKSYNIPDTHFYNAIDVACVPDEDNTKEFIDYILRRKANYANQGMFTR